MNQLNDYTLQPGTHLYRYDLKEPPKEWCSDFKNPEYVYPDRGAKNEIGAFFFFNSFKQAHDTVLFSLGKIRDKNRNGIWITKCTISEPIKLLDLRDSIICIELLAALDKDGFNIFSDELKSWNGISFSELAEHIQSVEDIVLLDTNWANDKDISKRVRNSIMGMQRILDIENTHIGHLLQLLTDFSNGVYFRKLLQDKGYEGYIFNETNCPVPVTGTDTICVFKPTKFQSPCVEVLYTEKETEASLVNPNKATITLP
jgi:hypothetical protein